MSQANRNMPEAGEIYRHFKGGEYVIENVATAQRPSGLWWPAKQKATHTETDREYFVEFRDTERGQEVKLKPHVPEAMVLYFSPRNPDKLWARPLSNFMEVVAGVNGGDDYRFRKVEADEFLSRPILQAFAVNEDEN